MVAERREDSAGRSRRDGISSSYAHTLVYTKQPGATGLAAATYRVDTRARALRALLLSRRTSLCVASSRSYSPRRLATPGYPYALPYSSTASQPRRRRKPVISTSAIGCPQRLLDSRTLRTSTDYGQHALDSAVLTPWDSPAPSSLRPSMSPRFRRVAQSAPPSLRCTRTLGPPPRKEGASPPLDHHPGSTCLAVRPQSSCVVRAAVTARTPANRLEDDLSTVPLRATAPYTSI